MTLPDKSAVDYSLYLVTDRSLSCGRSTIDVVREAVAGGVTIVQLRDKQAVTREFYREACKIRDFLKSKCVPLIVNDRIDIALAIDADGVHLGADDMPIDVARRLLGDGKIIGASVFTLDDAVSAVQQGADYLGLSPIFMTATKPELVEKIGIEGIARFRNSIDIPLVGIGGLNVTNAYDAIRAGLDGLATGRRRPGCISRAAARRHPQA